MNFGTFDAGEFCDKGYAVYFPAGRSYTGEDTVEFYLHGGVRIMQGALDALLRHGAVMAKRRVYKRAFLNGRLSLADAEGVIDMINAESVAGVKAAYRLMQGNVSKCIDLILENWARSSQRLKQLSIIPTRWKMRFCRRFPIL